MILGTNFIYLGTRREWSGLFWVLCGFSLIDWETHFSLFFPAFFLTSCLYTCYYATPVSPAHAYSTFFSSLILTTLMTQMSAENLELLSFSFLFLAHAVLHGAPLQPSSRRTLSLVSSPLFTLQERLSLMFFCCLCLSSFLLHSILYMAISLVFLWCPSTQITQVILLLKTSQHFLSTSTWKSRLLSLAFKYFEGGCSLWTSRIPAHPYLACQPHSLTVLWFWGVSVASHMATM